MTIRTDEDVVATTFVSAVEQDVARPYVDWAAVIAGAVIAWTIAFILGSFGSGLGLTLMGSPWEEGMSLQWFLIAAGIYFIWVQVTSIISGAYLSGRMRRRAMDGDPGETEVRDGVHGLLVWGVSALFGALIALGAAAGGAAAVSKVAGGVAAVGAEAISAGPGSGERISNIAGRLFRPEAGDAQSGRAPSDATSGAAGRGNRDSVLQILKSVALKGNLSEEDKTYISQVVARETGLSQEAARARVDGYLSTALTEIRQAAETARKFGIIAAFLTAATLLVSGIAGWWAAGLGGRHRDEGIGLGPWSKSR